jgi:hypothetical protein
MLFVLLFSIKVYQSFSLGLNTKSKGGKKETRKKDRRVKMAAWRTHQ